MGKSDQNKVMDETRANAASTKGQGAANESMLKGIMDKAGGTADSILPGVTAGYSNIAETGGYDPAVLARIRSGYGGLMENGGISPEGRSAMKNEAAQSASSVFQTQADAARRRTSSTGGFGGGDAISASLARQGGNAASDAAVRVDARLAGMEQEGKIAGVGGLERSERDLAGAKFAGTSGLANIYSLNEQQLTATASQILENYRTTGQLTAQDEQILQQISMRPGLFDNIMKGISTVGGAAAGVMGGVGAMSAGKAAGRP